MVRRIIEIDESLCNGCGLCAKACHEGAIGMVDGKARLLRDDYCDGLGDCLPACPTGAIRFVEREAAAYDEAAVKARQSAGCPGTQTVSLPAQAKAPASSSLSALRQWPVQLTLLPVQAPFYQGARLLVAADCSAFSRADFHERFMRGRITAIGCPKLDDDNYTEKLTEILRLNDIREVTVVRMEVPCCGGLQRAVENALQASGKFIPWQVITLGRDGNIIE